jgi:hypothetical protein
MTGLEYVPTKEVIVIKGIELTVVWSDQDVIKFRVTCSNGYFSGVASIYVGHDELPRLTEALRGFPSHLTDSRNFELGTFGPNYAGGGIRMHFYCRDSVGHAAVDVSLRGDACAAMGEVQSVALRLHIEAAAIDSFIEQLKALDPNEIGATARLEMAR